MNDHFAAGAIVGGVIVGVITTIIIGVVDTDRLNLENRQDQWIEQGVLQYDAKTGEIVPVMCVDRKETGHE